MDAPAQPQSALPGLALPHGLWVLGLFPVWGHLGGRVVLCTDVHTLLGMSPTVPAESRAHTCFHVQLESIPRALPDSLPFHTSVRCRG